MLHPSVMTNNYRETRDFACETKFLLNADQAELIRVWARAHLGVDPHGTGEQGDLYQVSSIYFDTPQFDVFNRQGSFGRSKYRIRRYNSGDTVFLERKTKTDKQVSKRRTLVPVHDLDHVQTAPQSNWSGYWFQRRLQLRGLQPVCRINYQRMARLGQAENGSCRLTMDNELTAQRCTQPDFDTSSGLALMPSGRYILELKYRYHLPVLFRQLLNEFAPLPQKVSKYRLAVTALGLVQSGLSRSNPVQHREVV